MKATHDRVQAHPDPFAGREVVGGDLTLRF
jgi:hypothetical protein